jgi:hypothetical protein
MQLARLAVLLLCLLACACIPVAKSHGKAAVKAPRPGPAAKPSPADSSAQALSAPRYTNYFDPQRAWEHMKAQVACGVRVSDSPGAAECRKYLLKELKATCDTVETQAFAVPQGGRPLRMVNLLGHIEGAGGSKRRLLLLAHWDTRPTADMNPPGLRNKPIPGANDGASGVAILLELARVFHAHRPPVGVDILLVDGEDYGPQMTMMFLGAKQFAAQLKPEQIKAYNYGILLDMVGDASLDLHPETHSEAAAADVYASAAALSQELGYSAFKTRGGYEIFDDHLPLIEKGVRVYDFIDFNYPDWHTTQDTLDKCSPASLEAVGRTVENMVYLTPNLYASEPLQPSTIPGGWR